MKNWLVIRWKALQVEPKEKQKEAMNYFLEQLATLDWLDDENVLKVLPMVGKHRRLCGM